MLCNYCITRSSNASSDLRIRHHLAILLFSNQSKKFRLKMQTRKKRTKRLRIDEDYVADADDVSVSSSHHLDQDDEDALRKSRIRDSNKEFNRRMTILQTWSEYWTEYTLREGEPYPKQRTKEIIAKSKKVACPIESCGKTFTTPGGLRYHYARCNLERNFKCIVCNPPLSLTTRGEILRHMIHSHYKELPELNDDQKEIANAYLSCEHKYEKVKKDKKFSNNEAISTAQNLVKSFYELQRRVFQSDNFSNRPFKEWQLFIKDWEPMIYETDRRRFYPPEMESVRFKANAENDWKVVKTGESIVFQRDAKNSPTSALFYTGGINTASSWLPKPLHDSQSATTPDLIAISVNCCSMDKSYSFKESQAGEGCIQFWSVRESVNKLYISLSYMVGHSYGTIFEMMWCPLGTSWQSQVDTGESLSRVGLLAIACGDGQLRILSVPHTMNLLTKTSCRTSESTLESIPVYKVRPTACLVPPGVGPSTNYQTPACKTIQWNLDDNQRLIAAGYSNGNVALFDLANNSPILYTNHECQHIYQPLKCWVAHGAPVTSISMLSNSIEKTLVATGSTDRQLKIWNPMDLNSCLTSDRPPITNTLWDYRYRGVVISTDSAFTSFSNRVTYRYPVVEGTHSITISTHRSTVWGLANSIITNSIATADAAGEVFILPHLAYKSTHRREKSTSTTHSLYTMVPQLIEEDSPQLVTLENSSDSVIIDGQYLDTGLNANSIRSNTDLNIQASSNLSNTGHPNAKSSTLSNIPRGAKRSEAAIGGDINPDSDDDSDAENCFSNERHVANKPTKFLIPIEHRPVEAYDDFKKKFGIQFINYNSSNTSDAKLPESCIRAADIKNIYCDRPCDYPFSSINCVSWSPNTATFSYLLSASHIGLCRLDKVSIVEQVYRGYVDSMKLA